MRLGSRLGHFLRSCSGLADQNSIGVASGAVKRAYRRKAMVSRRSRRSGHRLREQRLAQFGGGDVPIPDAGDKTFCGILPRPLDSSHPLAQHGTGRRVKPLGFRAKEFNSRPVVPSWTRLSARTQLSWRSANRPLALLRTSLYGNSKYA